MAAHLVLSFALLGERAFDAVRRGWIVAGM
jgi:hypothetical protein